MGIIFESSELAQEIRTEFGRQTSEAYSLELHHHRLVWIDEGAAIARCEPGAPIGRRFIAMLTRVLPIESQL
jgi:hypothetical protein